MLPEERTPLIQHLVAEALLPRTARADRVAPLDMDLAQEARHALVEVAEVIAEDAATASHRERTLTRQSL